MPVKISFLGAAHNVTGSRYRLEANGVRILVDCGLYQERELRKRNWDPFPAPPDSIDAILLTHAHLDHCGLLPKLVREGFCGKVYCTDATSEIAQIVLRDSAHIQEEDAKFKRKRHEREGRKGPYPVVPLYTGDDARDSFPLFATVGYEDPTQIGDGKDHPEMFDEEMVELIRRRESPFDFPSLKMTRTVQESKAINNIRGTAIIIAGSGMCTGGRIKHHLAHNISRPECTILFVGYQAFGTLGRQILDGAPEVRILGQMYPVKARVVRISGFSAHADKGELFRWVSSLQKQPRHIFVTHGEPNAAQHFAHFLKEETGWKTSVPGYRDEVVLDLP